HLYPVAVQLGSTNAVTAIGKFDPWPPKVWVEAPGIVFNTETNAGKFTVEIATNAPAGPHLVRVFNEQGASGPRFFIVTREPQAGSAAGVDGEPGWHLYPASVRLRLSGDFRRQVYRWQRLRVSPASLARALLAVHAAAGSSAWRADKVAALRLEHGLQPWARVRVRWHGIAGGNKAGGVGH